jgi:hypothetical protein
MLSLGERWTRYGVPAAVAGVFAAFWAVAVVVSDQPRTFDEQVQYAIGWAIFAAPPVAQPLTAPIVKPAMNRSRNRLNTSAIGTATSTVAA